MRKRQERFEPGRAVEQDGGGDGDGRGRGEPRSDVTPDHRSRSEQLEGQEGQGDPLERSRERPTGPCRSRATATRQHDGTERRDHHPNIVVAATGEVDREERIPADRGGGERGTRRETRGEHDQSEHPSRRQAPVQRRSSPGRPTCDLGDTFGRCGESWPVNRSRVAPCRRHGGECRVVRKAGWWRHIGVLAVIFGDRPYA